MDDLLKPFKLDLIEVQPSLGLVGAGETTTHLEPKQMTLLLFLAKHAGEVVTKEALKAHVWPDTHVSGSGITRNISQLRKALGDDRSQPKFIATVPKRGYCLLVTPRYVDQPAHSQTVSDNGRDALHPGTPLVEKNLATPEPTHKGAIKHPLTQHFRWRRFLPALVFFFLGMAATLIFFKARTQNPEDLGTIQPKTDSLAVLPLVNRNQDADTNFYADGISEELIDIFGRQKGLRVAARTSSFSFRNKQLDIRTIGQKLNVSNVLEGSVSRVDNRLRVSIRLIDTQSGFQVWSRTYERQAQDVFQVQLDIATAVAQHLNAETYDQETQIKGRTESLEAYDNYLLGLYWSHRGDLQNYPKAVSYLTKAIDLDPNYARAYATLARTWIFRGQKGMAHGQAWQDLAATAANKALALDRHQHDAHAVLGMVAMLRDQDWEAAELAMQKAIAIQPKSPLIYIWYAQVLMGSGQLEKAVAHANLAIQYDPFNPFVKLYVAAVFLNAERFAETDVMLSKILETMPGFRPAQTLSISLAILRKDWPAALTACHALDPDEGTLHMQLAQIYANLGDQEKATAFKTSLLKNRASLPGSVNFELALVQMEMKDVDQAIYFLQEALNQKEPRFIVEFATHPTLKPLRKHQGYLALSETMGL